MVLKGVNWVHIDKIRSNSLERSQLGTQYKMKQYPGESSQLGTHYKIRSYGLERSQLVTQ